MVNSGHILRFLVKEVHFLEHEVKSSVLPESIKLISLQDLIFREDNAMLIRLAILIESHLFFKSHVLFEDKNFIMRGKKVAHITMIFHAPGSSRDLQVREAFLEEKIALSHPVEHPKGV